jgi:hypothetical protein
MNNITLERVRNAVINKGYVWFDSSRDYDVNIVGIRNGATARRVTNLFDDFITCAYKKNGKWMFHSWEATVDPGITHTTQRLLNPLGVARLVEGQYRGAYQIGLHQGKYKALVQRQPVTVWRDNNKDMTFDETTTDTGLFGINIHRASPTGSSQIINGWSAGCQVFRSIQDFNQFMGIMDKAQAVSTRYTYTLINSSDL